MSKYADVYLVPIAENRVAEYKKIAGAAGRLFIKHGALRYREYVASDLDTEDVIPFPKIVKLKPGRPSFTPPWNSSPKPIATRP